MRAGGRPEDVWQRFLEANPWILGVSLAGQLLTSWDRERLEQVVAGASIAGPGKRVDALLETSGRIRALVFAEIKQHETQLLAGTEYRSGCWAPSAELVGAVTQTQRTVDIAVAEIGAEIRDVDSSGAETGEAVHLVRPRSFVIAGQLEQLRSTGGAHVAKYRSFELYAETSTSRKSSPMTSYSLERNGTTLWPSEASPARDWMCQSVPLCDGPA